MTGMALAKRRVMVLSAVPVVSSQPRRESGFPLRGSVPAVEPTPADTTRVSSQILNVEVVRTTEGLEGLKPEYDRLHLVCGNPLPFALHEWHVAWWNHLAKT